MFRSLHTESSLYSEPRVVFPNVGTRSSFNKYNIGSQCVEIVFQRKLILSFFYFFNICGYSDNETN